MIKSYINIYYFYTKIRSVSVPTNYVYIYYVPIHVLRGNCLQISIDNIEINCYFRSNNIKIIINNNLERKKPYLIRVSRL